MYGNQIGPGRRTIYTVHKGAWASHRGKPKSYIRPVMVGATDCTPGWRPKRSIKK